MHAKKRRSDVHAELQIVPHLFPSHRQSEAIECVAIRLFEFALRDERGLPPLSKSLGEDRLPRRKATHVTLSVLHPPTSPSRKTLNDGVPDSVQSRTCPEDQKASVAKGRQAHDDDSQQINELASKWLVNMHRSARYPLGQHPSTLVIGSSRRFGGSHQRT
jgi:hypothetical protein